MGVDRDAGERGVIRFRFEFDHGAIRIVRASRDGLRPVAVLLTAALLLAACVPTILDTVDGRSAQCASNPEPAMCEQAFKAVVTELGDRARDAQIRIDPVQCAHGRCWTWAYVTPAGAGGEQLLSVDWLPSGEISIGYVVQH